MDEMQILVPVAVKSKLTEQLKATLLAEIEQNLKRVDHDMSSWISKLMENWQNRQRLTYRP